MTHKKYHSYCFEFYRSSGIANQNLVMAHACIIYYTIKVRFPSFFYLCSYFAMLNYALCTIGCGTLNDRLMHFVFLVV